jgi:hypothetical protein
MNEERTLSYKLSNKFTKEDLEAVAAAAGTYQTTREITNAPSGMDVYTDVNADA